MAIWEKVQVTTDGGRQEEAVAPVIVSASRSTDIPAFYAEWFRRRWKHGYCTWQNPFNRKLQYVSFQNTRAIVFWSKNPEPLLPHLAEFDAVGYYFQFTLNDYEREGLEPNVPSLQSRIDTFKRLADRIGPERVIWRFDPLILGEGLSPDGLLAKMDHIARQIKGYTRKLVISFADIQRYVKVRNNFTGIGYREFTVAEMHALAEQTSAMNREWQFDEISACAEDEDLSRYGITPNRCIDDRLMAHLFANDVKLMNFLGASAQSSLVFNASGTPTTVYRKDKGQRKACGCFISKDIGAYNTCNHQCLYCYANSSPGVAQKNFMQHIEQREGLGELPI